jgi:hypothetical protein
MRIVYQSWLCAIVATVLVTATLACVASTILLWWQVPKEHTIWLGLLTTIIALMIVVQIHLAVRVSDSVARHNNNPQSGPAVTGTGNPINY